jgi:hypothetical protein
MTCPTCFNSSFRLSRLRSADVAPLLAFRYPVRCRVCDHRMHAGFLMALHLWQERKRKRQSVAPHRSGGAKAA